MLRGGVSRRKCRVSPPSRSVRVRYHLVRHMQPHNGSFPSNRGGQTYWRSSMSNYLDNVANKSAPYHPWFRSVVRLGAFGLNHTYILRLTLKNSVPPLVLGEYTVLRVSSCSTPVWRAVFRRFGLFRVRAARAGCANYNTSHIQVLHQTKMVLVVRDFVNRQTKRVY